MAETIGLQALLEDANFQAGVGRYLQGVSKMEATSDRGAGVMNRALGSIGGTIQRVGEIAAGVLLAGGISKIMEIGSAVASTGIQFDAMKQQAQIAFETMLGSGEKASAFLTDLQKFAAATPFEFPELVDASKKLIAFGVDAKDILPTLSKLGDLSAGVGVPVSELAELYGKAKVQGRLFAQDINQLTGRGIPIIQELAKQFGVSEGEVMKLVEAGKVGFPQLEKAVTSLTAKGSKFGGLMDKQSKSFKGLWSTVQDTYTQLSGKVMQPFFDLMTEGLQTIVDISSTPEFTKWTDDLAAGVSKFIHAGLLPFLKDTWTFLNTNIIPAATSLINIVKLLTTGDFSGGIFGLTEDSIFIGALFTARDVVKGLFDSLSKGDWAGAWGAVTGGAENLWAIINDQIGDPIALLQGKLSEGIQGVKDWIGKNGPATWDTLVTWGTEFWDWLTASPDGAMWQAAAKLEAVGGVLAGSAKNVWTSTIAPALAQWGTDFWAWLADPDTGALATASEKLSILAQELNKSTKDPETKATLERTGYDIANLIMDAIGKLFGKEENGKSLFGVLAGNIGRAVANGKELLETVAGALADGFWQAVAEKFGADAVTKKIAGAIGSALSKGAIEFVTGGGPLQFAATIVQGLLDQISYAWQHADWKNLFKLPSLSIPTGAPAGGGNGGFGGPDNAGGGLGTSGFGGTTVPASNAFAGATAAAQQSLATVPMSLQVKIGDQEIQNATATWSYEAVLGAMNQAFTQVQQGTPR